MTVRFEKSFHRKLRGLQRTQFLAKLTENYFTRKYCTFVFFKSYFQERILLLNTVSRENATIYII